MFNTSFGGGGYSNYETQQSRVDTVNKAKQKSKRISDATKGKKKRRKPENKGKHRNETTIRSGSERVGGTGFGTVNVIAPKAKNRKGGGRPVSSGLSREVRSLARAFDYNTSRDKVAVPKPTPVIPPRAPPLPPTRRDADLRATAERLRRIEDQNRADTIAERAVGRAREDARDARDERRLIIEEGLAGGANAIEARIANLEARRPVAGPIYNAPVYPPQPAQPAQPPITITNNPTFNPVNTNTFNPRITVDGRRQRGVGVTPRNRQRAPASSASSVREDTSSSSSEIEDEGGGRPRQRAGRSPTTPQGEGEISALQTIRTLLSPVPTADQIRKNVKSVVGKVGGRAIDLVKDGISGLPVPALPRAPVLPSSFLPAEHSSLKPNDERKGVFFTERTEQFQEAEDGTLYSDSGINLVEGSSSDSGSDTSLLQSYLQQEPLKSSSEEDLISQEDLERKRKTQAKPLPTQTEQAEDPLSFLETFQQTGGDVAVEPFEEPDEPDEPPQPVLKAPQPEPEPESRGGGRPPRGPPPSRPQSDSSGGEEGGSQSDVARVIAKHGKFRKEEVEEGVFTLSDEELIEDETARRGQGGLITSSNFDSDSGSDSSVKSAVLSSYSTSSGDSSSGSDFDSEGDSRRARAGISLISEAMEIPSSKGSSLDRGSLDRAERDAFLKSSSSSTPSSLGSPVDTSVEVKPPLSFATRERNRPAISTVLELRKIELGKQLNNAKRTARTKRGKQGFKTLERTIKQLEEDISLISERIANERSSNLLGVEPLSNLGSLASEDRPYTFSKQGGARIGGGRPALEQTSSEVLVIQGVIRDNVTLMRATKNIQDSMITTKNRQFYKDGLLGMVDLKEVNRIMSLYDETLTLKRELRLLKKI